MNGNKNQKGVALLAVIFLLVVIAFMGIVFISLSSNSMTQSVNELSSSRALYIAEGGVESARTYLSTPSCPTCTCASINGNSLFTNKTLGQGEFTVTTTSLGGQCTLTSTGGVPNIASGTAQRVVSLTVGGQDGWAVGQDNGNGQPVMLHWNGTSWTDISTTLPINMINGNNLTSVSMVSSSDGWSVSDGGDFLRLVGTIWTRVGSSLGISLWSVDMNSSSDGWSVGDPGNNQQQPFILYWNGSWAVRNTGLSTNAFNRISRTLRSIYCNKNNVPIDCWAVGDPDNNQRQPLILYWNGTSWGVRNTGLSSNSSNRIRQKLRSVFCALPGDCWAVGDPDNSQRRPLILHWDGAQWIVKNSGLSINQSLFSVYCLNQNDCWTVGDDSGNGQPVMLHWDGTTWVNFTASAPNLRGAILMSVTMVASNDAWAVSDGGDFIHWDGSSWTIHAQGTAAANGNQLNSIVVLGSGGATNSWREVPQ